MAFDQNTRGRLQKLVNACRALLSDDFSIQMQQVYGLDPNTGEVTPMARLTHLDDRQRHTAQVLRQVLVTIWLQMQMQMQTTPSTASPSSTAWCASRPLLCSTAWPRC